MSDDWQVVEDALTRLAPPTPESRRAFMALARLREREAQLERERDAHIYRADVLTERAEAAEARVAELTALVDELAAYFDFDQLHPDLQDRISALAHKEET